ncbi:unnamed protein product, partial [Mesorhabditis belari]|uniref:Anillin homology domain-containing protein n=1 Tax=Mesorhabditis belari TaxID=2138241 RepID=A0AAF3F0G3_9BILA
MSLSSKSSSSESLDISDILDCEKQRIVHKKREQLFSLKEEDGEMAQGYSGDHLENRSRASIGVSQISIPLAWNGEQHFKQKGESRSYSMFVTLQTKTNVIDSKILSNINRLDTDVTFPDSFVFHNEPEDFFVDLCIYAARTDGGNDASGSLRQRITRSFGKKFGLQVKSQLSEQRRQIPETVGSAHFNLIARCLLVLSDASEDCKIHDLKVSAFADLAGPPLYGHLVSRLVCLPNSVSHPLADGILTIRPKHSDSVFQHVRCRLQMGVLRCFVNNDIRKGNEQTLHRIVITPGSRVLPCNLEDSVILIIEPTTETPIYHYVLTGESKEAIKIWTNAIEHQLNDALIWGEFAYVYSRLSVERPREAIDGTISRDRSSRLYDTINISGTLSKSFMGSSGYNSTLPIGLRIALADQNSPMKTAPVRRGKGRANVKEIFKDVTQTQPTSSPASAPVSQSSESARNSRYIINLSVGEETPLKKIAPTQKETKYRSIIQSTPITMARTLISPSHLTPPPSNSRLHPILIRHPDHSFNTDLHNQEWVVERRNRC